MNQSNYISLKELPVLDGRYSVFGKLIDGMDVVDQLKEEDRIIRISLFSSK